MIDVIGHYSMMRSELNLKRHSDGIKKSNVLSRENIVKYMKEANDRHFLLAMVNIKEVFFGKLLNRLYILGDNDCQIITITKIF